MPNENHIIQRNSEEIQEIITSVPSSILRWGITIIFIFLISVLVLSSIIKYPDIVKTSIKVNSNNSPKLILAKQNGKITEIFVNQGDVVKNGQILAFMESTSNPYDILSLLEKLRYLQAQPGKISSEEASDQLPTTLNLGELQSAYQNFYEAYLRYQSTKSNGQYITNRSFLERDLVNIKILNTQILKQKQLQELEYKNASIEFESFKKLYEKKVISRSEFMLQENRYLQSKYPLQQTETAIINNSVNYSQKQKELQELNNTISESRSAFFQALNRIVNETNLWIEEHVLKATEAGKVSFAGTIQKNQNLFANQEVFIINPANPIYFGEVEIPQYNMGKVHSSEDALVKLKGYPFEQYGMIRGKLSYVSDVAYKDSVFVGKVSFDHFENIDSTKKIILKNGMKGDVEIITEESTLLQRLLRTLTGYVK
ncbi:HlyD family secretion protein [Pedobacter sandarakinus]|uniref:HlyD family secretion protein n=1 Tax=Pedobacter sandarakinus TaxID=353156 RepID=UPI002245A4F0|nr:HlyD family efflux transporter periplasmic adaptor subunit [Pedobacter sandarakinus]MCX2575955.1 HlyD family efflux transporter periplasmic adaptor subunit [Pedobacter sandarakinus]